MPFNPDQYLAEKGGFNPDAYLLGKGISQDEDPSLLTALGRGAAQGVSLGFADEIAGALGAGGGALAKGTTGDIVKDYIRKRDEYRQADSAAKAAHPYGYGGAMLTGGLATVAIPGLNIAKLGTLGARTAGAAALGGATGLGSSTADLTQGDIGQAVKDTAIGAGTGAVLQPAIEKVIAPAISGAGNAVGWAGKKFLNSTLDVPEGVTERYLANPDAVNNAIPKEELSQKLADTFGEVKDATGEMSKVATSALSGERTQVPGLDVRDAIDTLEQFDAPAAKQLSKRLEEEWGQRLADVQARPNAGYLTQEEAHEVKKTLQGLTGWKSPLPGAEEAQARNAAGSLNQKLREMNPMYAAGMDETAANIRLKQALAQKFGIQPDFSGQNPSGFMPTDRTYSAINQVARGNRIDAQRVVDALNDQGYGNLGEEIQNTAANEAFSASRPNGSRKAVMFGATGAAVGHATGIPGASYVGGAIGAGLGGLTDKYGPRAGKGLLDLTLGAQKQFQAFSQSDIIQKLSSAPATQAFVGAIQDAAQRGPGALAATVFILQQTEPEFNKAMSSDAR